MSTPEHEVPFGPEPSPVTLSAVPDYPVDVLPSAARSLVRSGEADGLPRALLGGAALAALAAALGSGPQLEVTPRWHERAILWVPLVASAGAGKSPAQGLAFAPIRDHDSQLTEGVPVLLDDLTLEALVRSLSVSGDTAALDIDELATLLRGLGEYKRGGGGDRGRFLKLWTGAPVRYVRVGGGGKATNQIDLRLRRPTVCICGGLQTRLHELLGGDEDGMRPRWLPHLSQLPQVDSLAPDSRHPADWQTLLGGDLLPIRDRERTWKLDSSGLAAFEQYRREWKRQARSGESASVSAALVKADVHLARIVLALAEAESPGHGGAVGSNLVDRGAVLVEFVLECWRALPEHGSLGLSWRDSKLDDGVERLRL